MYAVRSADHDGCLLPRLECLWSAVIGVTNSHHGTLLELGLLDAIDKQPLYHVDLQGLLSVHNLVSL
jgi:hypothetical protein